MLDTFIKCISIVYMIKLVLSHNLFIHHLKIKIKFLGLDIEVKSKKKVPHPQKISTFSKIHSFYNTNLIQYP